MIKNKKLNLLYDGSLLLRFFEKNSLRSGVFFLTYRVLQELNINKDFNIILHIDHGYDRRKTIYLMKKDNFFSLFKYVTLFDKKQFLQNIILHKEHIKSEEKFPRKFVFFIKIIKNYLLVIKYILFDQYKNNSFIKKIDAVFSADSNIPSEIINYENKNKQNIKKYIYLHDTIPLHFPEYYPHFFSTDNFIDDFAKIKKLNNNYFFFCNSECTKRDLLKYYTPHLNENNVMVCYPAPSHTILPMYDKFKLNNILIKYGVQNKNNKYIFSLCTVEPRKNLLFTVLCFIKFIIKNQIQDLFYYIGGAAWDIFNHEFEKKAGNYYEYNKKVVRLGYIDDEDINILYSNSLFFVFLSQYEGFGTPPLEAMQAGTPVITSNNSSLPEVVGDAAIMINYNSEEQCIKAFEDYYFNESLRNYYIKKGLERAKFFSWEKMVDTMSKKMLGNFNETHKYTF